MRSWSGNEGKNISDGNMKHYVWKGRDEERHFDLSQMVAWWLAGGDCKGRRPEKTEPNCKTVAQDSEDLWRIPGDRRFAVGVRLMLIGENILGYADKLLGKAAVAVCCGDGMEGLNRRDAVQIMNRETLCQKRAGLNSIPVLWDLVENTRRELVGSGQTQASRRSACSGLPLFLRFSGDRSFQGDARSGKARRSGNDFGDGRLEFREQGSGRVDQCADHFGGRHRRRLQGLMVIEHPSREHRFGGVLDPLIDQRGNFLAQICSVIESCQLKTLQ